MDQYQSGLSLKETVRAGMNIVDGEEYKEAFVAVSHATADVLRKTLGPYGHTTVIDDGQFRYTTKDGWSLVQRLGFGDPLYNTMYQFIKSISFNLVSKVGDGTTTAIIAADSFIAQMEKNPDFSKFRQRDVLKAMQKISGKVIDALKSPKYTHFISDDNEYEDIYRIAYTSTNENEDIARMIQKIYLETQNPNIYVNLGGSSKTSYTVTKGYRLDCGPKEISLFANTDSHEYVDKGNIPCFFVNHNVTFADHANLITELSKYGAANQTTVLLFAPYFDEALSSRLHEQNVRIARNGQMPTLMMVQTPMSDTIQRGFFDDAIVVAGAQAFTPNDLDACLQAWTKHAKDGSDNEDYLSALYAINSDFEEPADLIRTYMGHVSSISVGEKFVLFKEFNDSNPILKNRIAEVKRVYDEEREASLKNISYLNKNFMNAQLRYVRLMGKMGSIDVGGESEQEKQFLKDVVDDAVLACRSSFENGYVKGLNLATIGAISDVYNDLLKDENATEIENLVIDTLEKVYYDVAYSVMLNKYNDTNPETDAVWCYNESDGNALTAKNIIDYCNAHNCGFNIVTEEFDGITIHHTSDNKMYASNETEEIPLTVVNSVISDIEVLKACVSILTYVLTSTQLLSVNRTYDNAAKKRILEISERKKYETIADIFAKRFPVLSELIPLEEAKESNKINSVNDIDTGFYTKL